MRSPAGLVALALLVASLTAGAAAPVSEAPSVGAEAPWSRLMGPAQEGGLVLTPAQAAGLPPTIQDGIGPGSALQMGVNGIQNVCTAAFLVRDPATARYYLATAGHCLVRDADDPTVVTGATHPDMTKDRVDICVDGCMNNGLGLGTYVSLRAGDGYHPVAYAVSGGVGKDFGLIELPAELHGHLRPAMPQWGGPTGVASSTQLGSLVAHYGHGTLLVPGVAAFVTRTPADQGRLAVLSSNAGNSFEAVGHVTGGDSGSGINVAQAGADLAHGTEALGVITHSIVYVGAPILSGTRMHRGLELAAERLGVAFELVPEGDPLTTIAEPAAAPAFDVNVSDPRPGAKIDLGSKRVTVRGTAEARPHLPAGAAVQLAVDDPSFSDASRVPVAGNTTWSAVWELAKVPAGQHVLRARLVDADGAVLDQENVTVTLTKSSASASSTNGPRTGGSSGSPGTGGATSNGPAAGDDGDSGFGLASKPAPALPVAFGLAAVALAAALRRRP